MEAFETPLLALGIYAAVRWRPRLFIVCVALILACKEDSALYAIPLALWVAVRRDRKIGSILIGASAAIAGLDNLFLVPALIGYASAHGGRLPFGGVGGTLRAIIRTPDNSGPTSSPKAVPGTCGRWGLAPASRSWSYPRSPLSAFCSWQ